MLGGGGVTGIAWELGMLAGLAQAGVSLCDADLIVGTSAGSVVGAQITSPAPIEELYERQLEAPSGELPARLGPRQQLAYVAAFVRARGDVTGFGRRLGDLSMKAAALGGLPTVEQRLAVIASRLPAHEWPDRDLRVTAINANTGKFRIITRQDAIALIEAVAASCAVPGVFPAIPIDGELYVDGGFRSTANVDVARGCTRLVVLAPLARGAGPIRGPQQQADQLGIPAAVITPDSASLAAIGDNVLDPAARRGAAVAGRAQAAGVAEQVREVWG